MRAGSYLPTQRGTSSASLRAAAPDRRPHTAPDLLPVAYPRSREHDEEPLQRWRIPTRARSNSANFLTHDTLKLTTTRRRSTSAKRPTCASALAATAMQVGASRRTSGSRGFCRVLPAGGRCRVSVAEILTFQTGQSGARLDLRLKAARVLVESAAIVLARNDGMRSVLNLTQPSTARSAVAEADRALARSGARSKSASVNLSARRGPCRLGRGRPLPR